MALHQTKNSFTTTLTQKNIYPLLWDVSVAGHIDAGETFFEAAIRECKEEIGLTLTPKILSM